jgi:phenylalanyl-tRNA synthetase alpha chain
MGSDLEQVKQDLLGRIGGAGDLAALEAERVAVLGKQGVVTGLLKTLGGMTPEERQSEGPRIHGLREAVTAALGRLYKHGARRSVETLVSA